MSEAIYCFDRATVRFAIYPDGFDGPRVLAEITQDALCDVFGARGGGDELMEAYDLYAPSIEEQAAAVYRLGLRAPIVLRAGDFSMGAGRALHR